jgi:plasmid maintenance system antidote protein VapI
MSMAALEQVQFGEEQLEVALSDGTGFIAIRSVCRALGLDNKSQQVKLKSRPWACVALITTQVDGQRRRLFFIDLESLPMWLATIETSRVRPQLRPRLIAYQRECTKVLRDHFLRARRLTDRTVGGPGSSDDMGSNPAVAPLALPAHQPDQTDPALAQRSPYETLLDRIEAGARAAQVVAKLETIPSHLVPVWIALAVHDLTIVKLAELIGWGRALISGVLHGKHSPTKEFALSVGKVLGPAAQDALLLSRATSLAHASRRRASNATVATR